jgi:hypothetical protein
VAALCCAQPARAQGIPAAIDLRVLDGETGAPLAGASVRLDGVARGTSDARGVLRLSPLGPGRHLLQVGMLGRQPVAPEVNLVSGGELALDVILEPDVVPLPPMAVVARLRHPRLGADGGDTPAAVREREALLAALEVHAQAVKELSAPVRDPLVPQVRGRLLADPTADVAGDGGDGEVCIPDLFVDGVPVEYKGAVYLGDLAQAAPDPRDGPPEFGEVTSKCGAILIWTDR